VGGVTGEVNGLAFARETFLTSGELDDGSVRDTVGASWRRSRFWGVDCDRVEPPYRDDIDFDSRLVHAAQPVMDRLEIELADARMTAILTDAAAYVLDRRAGSPSLNSYLDSVLLAPGFTYAEKFIGTNGIGTALEERRPSYVFGHEHFVGTLQSLSCAGSPIRDPLNGRVVGIIDVTCWEPDASLLMNALVREAARDIESRLFEQSCERERALLQEFLAACRRTRKPVLSLSKDLIITNVGAAHLLDPDDHAIIRDTAVELTSASRRETTGEVLLSRGQVAQLRCRPVTGDAGIAGTIVEIDLFEEGEPRAARTTTPPAVSLPGLAGHSPAWVRVCHKVDTLSRRQSWVLLVGEPGVGKVALAEAAHRKWSPHAPFIVIDAAEHAETAAEGWADTLGPAPHPAGTVVFRHVDQLTPEAARALAEALAAERRSETRLWVVGTLDGAAGLGRDLDGLLQEFATAVTVPPLRHRMGDVPDLVAALVARLAPGSDVECGPEAIHTLLRMEWPGNVADLERVLRAALERRRVGQIKRDDLPEECHATNPRVLTRWEALERDAIIQALVEAEGNRTEAAARLSISRATIYRKIHAYGIAIEGREK
jgi:transcriptional regulator of acetoin/glycerol metabolism